ncbi:hypothetical protein ZIOFF_068333 [Zingiber officinale]|uniref:Uncharacterized protein n=1 Tax=Zingiber officinale TaxID=94328 RepID=A0A8J5CY38_ZINOF|nr:hypothetical protein ZIOFF_068333 [Zingiber officinale]
MYVSFCKPLLDALILTLVQHSQWEMTRKKSREIEGLRCSWYSSTKSIVDFYTLVAGSVMKRQGVDGETSDSLFLVPFDGESAFHLSTHNELASESLKDSENQFSTIMHQNDITCEERTDLTEKIEKRSKALPLVTELEFSTNTQDKDGECIEPLYPVTPEKTGTVAVSSELFSDKTITHINLHEVIEGRDCQVIKDICVDDGLRSCEKNLCENTVVSEKLIRGSKSTEANSNDALSQKMADSSIQVQEETEPISVADSHAMDEKLLRGFTEIKEILDESNKISYGKVTLQQLFSLGELETDMQGIAPGGINDDKKSPHQKKTELVSNYSCGTSGRRSFYSLPFDVGDPCETSTDIENHGGIVKGNSRKKSFSATSVPIDISASKNDGVENNAPNDQLEIPSTSDFKPGAETEVISGTGMDEVIMNNAHNHSVSEITFYDPAAASDQRMFYHNNHGHSNFTDPSVSGPRGTSGHLAYSGSISLRSDSSTTSTRSFAFPVSMILSGSLQSS